MATLLLVGYREFSRYYWNPAEEVVNKLNGIVVHGHHVVGVALPVSYRVVKRELPLILDRHDPVAVFGVGLAPSASKVVVEAVAANIAYFEDADVDGYRAKLEPVIEGGEKVLPAPVELSSVYKHCIRDRGVRARIGVSVGTYLCNVLAYTIYWWAWRRGRKALFMHIPPTNELAMRLGMDRGVAFQDIIDAVQCIIEVVVGKEPI